MNTATRLVLRLRIPVGILSGEKSDPFTYQGTIRVGPFLNELAARTWSNSFTDFAMAHKMPGKKDSWMKRIEARTILGEGGRTLAKVSAAQQGPGMERRPFVEVVIGEIQFDHVEYGSEWDVDPGAVPPKQLSNELIEWLFQSLKQRFDEIL